MADDTSTEQYVVVGHAALITQDGPMGRAKLTLLRGSRIGPGMTDKERDHNLSGGLIAKVPADEPAGIDAAGEVVSGTERVVGDTEPGSPADPTIAPTTPNPTDESVAAPLPADGSAPPQAASKATWVEYGVAKGMDRAEAEKATKADLVAALKS